MKPTNPEHEKRRMEFNRLCESLFWEHAKTATSNSGTEDTTKLETKNHTSFIGD